MKRGEWLEFRTWTLDEFAKFDYDDKDKEAADASIEHADKHLDRSSGEEETGHMVAEDASKTMLDVAGNEFTLFMFVYPNQL